MANKREKAAKVNLKIDVGAGLLTPDSAEKMPLSSTVATKQRLVVAVGELDKLDQNTNDYTEDSHQ